MIISIIVSMSSLAYGFWQEGYPDPARWIVLIGLVWLLNLYNFMDGINGIASVEAITTCLGGIILYIIHG